MNLIYKVASIILVILFFSGCSKGQPACADKEVVEILDGLLSDKAKIGAIGVQSAAKLRHGTLLLGLDPKILLKVQEGENGEAFDLMEAALANPPFPLTPIYKHAVTKAKESTFILSGIKTEEENEHRTSCSASVEYTFGLPSAEMVGEHYHKLLSSIRVMNINITYDTYYADDGTLYIELDK